MASIDFANILFDDKLTNDIYSKSIDSSELTRFSESYIDGYYKIMVGELEDLNYIDVEMWSMDLLLDIIDIYNANFSDLFTLDKLINDKKIFNKFIDFLGMFTDEENKKFCEKIPESVRESYLDLKTCLKSVLMNIILSLENVDPFLINKIDNLIIEHSIDNVQGYIPHICLYKNHINDFFAGESYQEFIIYVNSDLINWKIVKNVILANGSFVKISNKEDVLNYLKNLKTNSFRYSILMCEFIKLHRKANLEKKRLHIKRVCLLSWEKVKVLDIVPFFKNIMFLSALYHDLGRFYHGAYYDGFTERPIILGEKNFGVVDSDLNINHATAGYYISSKSFVDFDTVLKKDESIVEEFSIVSPILYSIIQVHGGSNSLSPHLYYDAIYLLDDLKKIKSNSDAKGCVCSGLKGLYKLCAKFNIKKKKCLPAFDTIFNQTEFYNRLLKDDSCKNISEDLNLVDLEIRKKIDVKVECDVSEYDISAVIIKVLELYKKVFENAKEIYPDIKTLDKETCEKLIKSNDIKRFGLSQDELCIFDYIRGHLEFVSLLKYTTLLVMDIDKIDIIVQMANGWLDNDLKLDADLSVTNIKVSEQYLTSEGIDLKKFFGRYYNVDINDEKLIDFESKLFNLLGKCNDIQVSKDGIISIKDCKNIVRDKKGNYLLKTSKDVFAMFELLGLDKNKLQREQFLPDDVIKYYLCIDEKNGEEGSKIKSRRTENDLHKLWWRISEFFLKNMRLVSSFELLDEIDLMENLLKKLFRDFDNFFANMTKPLLYVLYLYINKVMELKFEVGFDAIDFETSEIIRREIGCSLKEELKHYGGDIDALLKSLTQKYDYLKLKRKHDI